MGMDIIANYEWCLRFERQKQQKDDKSETRVGYTIVHLAKLESYDGSDRFTELKHALGIDQQMHIE